MLSSGVYAIRNTISGRVYVGSGILKRRRFGHFALLRQGKHHSPVFQRSYNLHGEAAFVFEVLEHVTDSNLLAAREQFWIDRLHAACPRHGLNAAPIAGRDFLITLNRTRKGQKRPPFTAEHRARIAAARRGTKASAETKAKMSAIRKGRPKPKRTAAHCAAIRVAKKGISNPAIAASNRRRKGRRHKNPRQPNLL